MSIIGYKTLLIFQSNIVLSESSSLENRIIRKQKRALYLFPLYYSDLACTHSKIYFCIYDYICIFRFHTKKKCYFKNIFTYLN